ncbi:MAG: hypothetical protein ACLTE4_10665, partial [Christensenellaceae bacterium]
MRKLAAVLLSVCLCMLMGCSPKTPPVSGETELIPDFAFNEGFVLTGFDSRPEFNQRHIGEIDYGLDDLDPVWRIGQWGCLKNLVNAEYSQNSGVDVFEDGSKVLKVNRKTGAY